MTVKVNDGSMNIFLDSLKSLIRRSQFEIVEFFGHVKPEIIDKCSDLFEKQTINTLQLWHECDEYAKESSSFQLWVFRRYL